MCTYETELIQVSGSGKRGESWFHLSQAMIYHDHPVHAAAEHTLNVDFINPSLGPSARVAVELDKDSARALAAALTRVLDASDAAEAVAPGADRLPGGYRP